MKNRIRRNVSPRIVICGFGAVTPLGKMGTNDTSLWDALKNGRTAIRPFGFDPDEYKIGARVASWINTEAGTENAFDMRDYLHLIPFHKTANPKLYRTDLAIQLGVAAAALAFENAELNRIKGIGEITGVSAATGLGGGRSFADGLQSFTQNGGTRRLFYTVPNVMPNAVGGTASIVFGLKGPSTVITTACASGNYAICDAADKIRLGRTKVMLVIGAEAMAMPFMVSSFDQLNALSPNDSSNASQPFGLHRSGFVMGEGAGAIILAEMAWVEKHELPILAELLGYATNSGATDIVKPSIDGAVRCMESALDDARLPNNEIDYINAHGTSTLEGDQKEAEAIWDVFADRNSLIPPELPIINSSKALIGHNLGAAGVIEAIITVMSLQEGVIHPMGDYEIDPNCLIPPGVRGKRSLNPHNLSLPITTGLVRKDIRKAMSPAFGFGDHNAVVISGKVG